MPAPTTAGRLLHAELVAGRASARRRVQRAIAERGVSRAHEALGVDRATVFRWVRRWPELRARKLKNEG